MPSKTLRKLYSHFVARTDFLVSKYDYPLPLPRDAAHRDMCQAINCDGRALMIIRLQLLWGEFCRELVVRSALGGCRTVSGSLLSRGATVSAPQAIQQAVERRRRPPTWHITTFAVAIARILGTQNYQQIYLALTQVSPVDDLRIVRNYIVHPGETTRIAYEQVAWKLGTPEADPVSLLAFRLSGGATRFETWVADFQLMALNAVR